MDSLDEFEKALAEEKKAKEREERNNSRDKERKHKHHHRSSHRPRDEQDGSREQDNRRYKRSRHSTDREEHDERRRKKHAKTLVPLEDLLIPNDEAPPSDAPKVVRDSWMTAPDALEFDYTQRGIKKVVEAPPQKPDYDLKIHKNELNRHLQNLADGKKLEDIGDRVAQHEVDYTFGDAGAQWVSNYFSFMNVNLWQCLFSPRFSRGTASFISARTRFSFSSF